MVLIISSLLIHITTPELNLFSSCVVLLEGDLYFGVGFFLVTGQSCGKMNRGTFFWGGFCSDCMLEWLGRGWHGF